MKNCLLIVAVLWVLFTGCSNRWMKDESSEWESNIKLIVTEQQAKREEKEVNLTISFVVISGWQFELECQGSPVRFGDYETSLRMKFLANSVIPTCIPVNEIAESVQRRVPWRSWTVLFLLSSHVPRSSDGGTHLTRTGPVTTTTSCMMMKGEHS